MKNLYFILLLVWAGSLNAQNQNANWYFGSDNWVRFNTAPSNVTIPTVFNGSPGNANPFSYLEGCASVSSPSGVLLFVTDGISVYENTGTSFDKVTDGLLGHNSSAQNVIIVPRPNKPLSYYIFTIAGANKPDGWLYYSEISFNTATNHWVMVSLNTALLTGANMPQFLSGSEGITSVEHSNCTDYWVVTHFEDGDTGNLYSYLVTENGVVNNIPTSSLNLNVPASEGILRCIKVSHSEINTNVRRLALTSSSNGVFLGTFNTSNGLMAISNNISPNTSAYGVEFSPNSNFLYYTLLSTPALLFSRIDRYDIANNLTNSVSTSNTSERLTGMQLAADGNIYVIRGVGISSPINQLNVIVDPNNTVSTLDLNANYDLVSHSSNLPQWVSQQECCLPDLTLFNGSDNVTNDFPDVVTFWQRSNWIKASNVIGVGNNNVGDGVVYHAGNYVELKPGFEAVAGSQFSAYIQDCSGNYTYKNGGDHIKETAFEINSTSLIKNKINIYPNPTNSYFTVNYANEKFNRVIITSLEGRVILNQKMEAVNSYQLDISSYKTGIYTLSIQTNGGNTITDKLIKN